MRGDIETSSILSDLGLEEQTFFLLSAHREENVDSPERLGRLLDIIDELTGRYSLPIVVSTHPRTRQRLDKLGRRAHPLARFEKPFGFLDYVKLQKSARAVLSDSGTITEESAILNFRAVNLRDVHERPEGFEEASVMFVGLDAQRVGEALAILETTTARRTRAFCACLWTTSPPTSRPRWCASFKATPIT